MIKAKRNNETIYLSLVTLIILIVFSIYFIHFIKTESKITAKAIQTYAISYIGTLSTTERYAIIGEASAISFSINNENHIATLLIITSDSATIQFASTPSQVTLKVGETREIDLNDNGQNDLSVKLISVRSNDKLADLIFRAIEETPSNPPLTNEQNNNPLPFGAVKQPEARKTLAIIAFSFIILGMLTILILGILVRIRKKEF